MKKLGAVIIAVVLSSASISARGVTAGEYPVSECRLLECTVTDDSACQKAVTNAIRHARRTITVSFPGSITPASLAAELTKAQGRGVRVLSNHVFRRFFCLAADGKKALLGGWSPPGKIQGDLLVIGSRNVVRALENHIKGEKAAKTAPPGLWFPENGSFKAWRRLSLPRKKLFFARPWISPEDAGTLAAMKHAGIKVEVETPQGLPRQTETALKDAGVSIKTPDVPLSRYRRFIVVSDNRVIFGLPDEVLVLTPRLSAKGDEGKRGGVWHSLNQKLNAFLTRVVADIRQAMKN